MSQKLRLSTIKSNLNCWLLITVQCMVVAVQNKLNVFYILRITFGLFVYLFTLLKKRILETRCLTVERHRTCTFLKKSIMT